MFLCSDLSRSSTLRRFVSLSATKTRQEVEIKLLVGYPKTCTERRFIASFCNLSSVVDSKLVVRNVGFEV